MTTIGAHTAHSKAAVAGDGWQGAHLPGQIALLAGRSLRALARNPKLLIISLLQPMVFLVLLTQVFSSLGTTANFPAGATYVDYLMPGFLVVSALSVASEAGVALTTELRSGLLARFRALPISRSSVLFARSVAEVIRNVILMVVLLGLAMLVFGFDPAGGLAGLGAALLLATLMSASMVWVFLALAAWLRNPEAMQALGFLLLFPLMFVSSMFVPVANLPGWLQAVAKVNPVTYAIDASRSLTLDLPVGNLIAASVATSAGLMVVGIAAAVAGFRRPL
ncbi:ABC transporter permease [Dactylosporangium sp. AC04546]|uniref:ABC transporter permease n=1 Tax=Dactylosporangium sp. AC04546 TaxID=2862460 RepID=UPI001EDE1668|nr:ABC transporter permease [Dactylosporangium sp. AC04546]WVK79056.1 ABC transporter permease [Dactylosporangium sp. AC04546]